MFVKSLFADNWVNRNDTGVDKINPTWEQVKKAILNLNGKSKTMVLLSDRPGGDKYLGVCGKWDECFLVNSTSDNVDFFSLVDKGRSNKKITLFVGGQDGDYAENKCVPLDWVLEAAEHFFETGELKPDMNWVSEF
jgi:hypothetical protein